jgi:hypothetical protein
MGEWEKGRRGEGETKIPVKEKTQIIPGQKAAIP